MPQLIARWRGSATTQPEWSNRHVAAQPNAVVDLRQLCSCRLAGKL